jgi:DNA-binding SARP family transcriptional activator/WD40 repeat protein
MRFLVLGPLEVLEEGGDPAPIAGSKERTILAFLLARSGSVVSVDELIDELWRDDPPRTAEKTIGSYVSRLRRALDGKGGDRGTSLIVSRGDGYELRVDPEDVDARAFETHCREGHERLVDGDDEASAQLLGAALGLWRGEAYQGLRYTGFGAAEAERLDELRRAAAEDLVDARLGMGAAPELIPELEGAVREAPLRERRWNQLMLALYRSGRQAEALEAYRRARTVLEDELGIEPGPDLQALHTAILRQDRDLVSRASPSIREMQICPYKGLARFETTDAEFYFGREQILARGVARLVEGRFLALVGASGSGKSSLLRAGVLHALEAGAVPGSDRWSYELVRPGSHPLEVLHEAIDGDVPREPLRRIVAIDQFEETFTACADDVERVAFLDAIVDAVGPDGRVTLIVAMRADFYGRCAEHRAFAELLEPAQILVGPMDAEELRRAIEAPARQAHLNVEDGLADELVQATVGQPGALPLLSTTMLELWTQRRDGTLTLEAYRRSGGVEGAVARLAEDAYGRLNEEQQAAAKRILLRLAAESDGSEVVGRQAPLDEFDLENDEAAERALVALTEARLLTASDPVVEVAHEALFREWPRLRGWLEDDVQGRSLHRHLTEAARSWSESGHEDADLYRGARLTAALGWADEHPRDANELERLFLERSRSAAEGEAARTRRTNRRLRGLLAGVAVLLVLALVVGNVAIDQRNAATEQGLAADARQLATRSLSEEDGVLALLIARQAVALHDSPDTRSALLAALEREPTAIGALYPDGIAPGDATVWLRLSRDGRILASGGARHQVTLFDTATLREIWTIDIGHATNGGDFDPGGHTLTLATDDQHLINVDVTSSHITDDVRTEGGLQTVRYTPDGSIIMTAETDRFGHSSMVVHDPVTLETMASGATSKTEITGFAFSPDGRRIVTTSLGVCFGPTRSDTGTTAIWRTRDFSQIGSAEVSGSGVIVSEDGHAAFLSGASGAQGCNLEAGGQLVRLDLDSLQWSDSEPITGHRKGAGLRGVVLGPDGSVITGGDDGNLTVWDGRTLAMRDAFGGPAGVPERSSQVSPDGSTAYSVDDNGTIVVWDLAGTRRLIAPFRAGSGSDYGPWFAVSPDGRTLAIPQSRCSPERGCWYGSVRVVDTSTLRGRYTVPSARLGGSVPEFFAFSHDGRSLAMSGDAHVRVLDAETGSPDGELVTVPDPKRGDYNLWVDAYSPDGSILAVAGDRHWVDPANGEFRRRGVVFVFDASTHALIRRLPESRYAINWILFTPDGRRLVGVTAAEETPGRVMVWSMPDGTLISDTKVDDSGIYTEDISADGRLLVTGSESSNDVKLIDLANFTQVGASFGGPTGVVYTVDISPDGTTLAAAGVQVYLWDLASGTALGTPFPGKPPRNVASFSPDGRRLYVLGVNGDAWVWDIDPASWQTRACQVAGRTLTPEEWSSVLPDRPFDPACA